MLRRPRPADADAPPDDAPVRRRAAPPMSPLDPPPRRRAEQRGPGLVTLLWTVIGLLVLVSAGLVAAIVLGIFTPKSATIAAAPQAPAAARPAQQPAAPAAPKIEVTKQQAYGDWIYACVKVPNTTETRCQISQQLSDTQTKQPVFAWRITQDGQGGLVGEWETRSGVMVDRGIVMEMGTDKPVTIPFRACVPQACSAVAKLTPEVIAAISKATNASATLFPVGSSKPVKLALSVKGLSEALAVLQPAQAPAPAAPAAPATPKTTK